MGGAVGRSRRPRLRVLPDSAGRRPSCCSSQQVPSVVHAPEPACCSHFSDGFICPHLHKKYHAPHPNEQNHLVCKPPPGGSFSEILRTRSRVKRPFPSMVQMGLTWAGSLSSAWTGALRSGWSCSLRHGPSALCAPLCGQLGPALPLPPCPWLGQSLATTKEGISQ